MRDRAHVAKRVESYDLHLRKCGQQYASHTVSRGRRAGADHVQDWNIELTKCRKWCGLGEKSVRPSANVHNGRSYGLFARFWRTCPGAVSHPVVNKRLCCSVSITALEGGAGHVDGVSNTISHVWRCAFGVYEREQRWFEQREGANSCGVRKGCYQGDCAAVGMSNQHCRVFGLDQHWLDQCYLVSE